MDQDARTVAVEPPRGTFPARVDDKGRLKLPVAIQQYLGRLGESTVFITTLDVKTVRLYPTSVWRQNEELFARLHEDSELVENVQSIANHFGADSDIDNQGRVLAPTLLRRALGIENQPVWLECQKGRINLYSQQAYDERLERAKANAAANVRELERKGLR